QEAIRSAYVASRVIADLYATLAARLSEQPKSREMLGLDSLIQAQFQYVSNIVGLINYSLQQIEQAINWNAQVEENRYRARTEATAAWVGLAVGVVLAPFSGAAFIMSSVLGNVLGSLIAYYDSRTSGGKIRDINPDFTPERLKVIKEVLNKLAQVAHKKDFNQLSAKDKNKILTDEIKIANNPEKILLLLNYAGLQKTGDKIKAFETARINSGSSFGEYQVTVDHELFAYAKLRLNSLMVRQFTALTIHEIENSIKRSIVSILGGPSTNTQLMSSHASGLVSRMGHVFLQQIGQLKSMQQSRASNNNTKFQADRMLEQSLMSLVLSVIMFNQAHLGPMVASMSLGYAHGDVSNVYSDYSDRINSILSDEYIQTQVEEQERAEEKIRADEKARAEGKEVPRTMTFGNSASIYADVDQDIVRSYGGSSGAGTNVKGTNWASLAQRSVQVKQLEIQQRFMLKIMEMYLNQLASVAAILGHNPSHANFSALQAAITLNKSITDSVLMDIFSVAQTYVETHKARQKDMMNALTAAIQIVVSLIMIKVTKSKQKKKDSARAAKDNKVQKESLKRWQIRLKAFNKSVAGKMLFVILSQAVADFVKLIIMDSQRRVLERGERARSRDAAEKMEAGAQRSKGEGHDYRALERHLYNSMVVKGYLEEIKELVAQIRENSEAMGMVLQHIMRVLIDALKKGKKTDTVSANLDLEEESMWEILASNEESSKPDKVGDLLTTTTRVGDSRSSGDSGRTSSGDVAPETPMEFDAHSSTTTKVVQTPASHPASTLEVKLSQPSDAPSPTLKTLIPLLEPSPRSSEVSAPGLSS
ncbi:MAG: hypothetical protein HRT90_09575, partial [Candidatus Margulisbacteria bacterium]|nr:hypothetical protein [Candidatus Margulisiibacteriota bacterium]